MRPFAPVFLALLFATQLSAAQQNIPPHLLVRTICAGEKCEVVNRLAPQVAPTISREITNGTLLVDGEDPLAGCLERLDRDRTLDISRCAQRQLAGLKTGNALKDTEQDGYLVVILKQERNDGIQGYLVLLTQMGQTVESDLLISALTADGMGHYQAGIAPPDATFVVDAVYLGERAARAGLAGIPLRGEVLRFASPAGTANIWGTGVISPR